ncbi:MAG: polyphenol oxidase family protein [Nitrospirae bacterium]|nr:polyphenol oxidase family protein [Nitrospirota bacterium]MCL5286204.1 polyphenol oxidase family protein [Nitrospirota bacterium]
MHLRHPLLSSLGVDHGFGTIRSEPRNPCLTLRQVHGTTVISSVECRNRQEVSEGDGVITGERETEIGVWTADCLPVFVASESGGFVGAFHAGWRGAAAGIVPEGLSKVSAEGRIPVSGLRVVLGPAIGPCCYEVGPEVWEAVHSRTPTYVQGQERTLDLWGLVTHQLLLAGVPERNIGCLSLCTRCHPELFYSHRGWGTRRMGRSMLNYIRPAGDDRG